MPGPVARAAARRVPGRETVREACRVLRSGEPAGLLLGGGALLARGVKAAGRIAAATGAPVFADRFAARFERGRGRFAPVRLAYFPEGAEAQLDGLKKLLLVESRAAGFVLRLPGAEELRGAGGLRDARAGVGGRRRHGGARGAGGGVRGAGSAGRG